MFAQLTTNTKRNALIVAGTVLLAATTMTGAAQAKPKNFHLHLSGGGFGVHIGHGYHGGYRPCRRLRRKAMWTGSPFWWRRYRRCMRRNYW